MGYYQRAAQSPAYSEALRNEARELATKTQERLQGGDFKVGDRIRVIVEGQPTLTSDSFAVSNGPELILPGVGSVNLAGVLTDEMESAVRLAVSRSYRGAVVRAERLLRMEVEGGVGRPGFYSVRGAWRIDDVIGAAGGPGQTSELRDMRLERGRAVVMEAESLQVALRTSRTLDDLQVLDGDRLVVPVKAPNDLQSRLQVLYVLTTVISLVSFLTGRYTGR